MFENQNQNHENLLPHVVRLAARGSAVICLTIILLFLLGEGLIFEGLSFEEWVGLAFFPIGTLVGTILGWRDELLGGAIVIGSILGFYIVFGWYLSGSIRQCWAFLPFIVPGVLFLIHGLLVRFRLMTVATR